MRIEITAIGIVEGARSDAVDDFWGGAHSRIALDTRFPPDALCGLDAFSHAEVLFHFDRADPAKITTGARRPRNNPAWPAIGIFAQRGKNRPNRLGSTICRILRVSGRHLYVAELDAIEGTPVIDIKPVMREFLPRGPHRQPRWCAELMESYWKPGDTPEES